MSNTNGANPLRWDCTKCSCFNIKKRPKIEIFADCLPGKIAFTDVDAIVEIEGNLLLLEWKDHQAIPTGQRILFERMTLLCPAVVFVVEGDAEHMTVKTISVVWAGKVIPHTPANIETLRMRIKAWANWARHHKRERRDGQNYS